MVLIDHREKKSGIVDLFHENNINHKLELLKYGDYIINNNIAIERKTSKDFIKSIIDGRIFRQTIGILKNYIYSCIIIEGNPFKTEYNIHENAIKGALIELNIFLSTPIMFTNSIGETFDRIIMIKNHNSIMKTKTGNHYRKKPKRIKNKQLYIVQSLPMIGNVLAKKLLSHFGTIKNIINSSEEELRNVYGISTIISKKIFNIINKNF